VYFLKDNVAVRRKFEKELYRLGGEYFSCSNHISRLIREGEYEEAKKIFYDPFIEKLFPEFVNKEIETYGKWEIVSVEGWRCNGLGTSQAVTIWARGLWG
jgi:hypothetical protein